MIFEALSCITEEINQHFRNKLKINEEKVVLSGIVGQDGSLTIQGNNKLLITLVNIENDTTGKSNGDVNTTRTLAYSSSEININLYLLFSASFTGANYPESLKFLSYIIAYFQNKNVFDHSNTPNMNDGIARLIFKMENMGFERLNNLWATLGAKYMPSVMYKIRMLTFDDSIIREYRPAISGMSYDHKM